MMSDRVARSAGDTVRRASPFGLAALLAVSGTLHFVAPSTYESIVPRMLPARRAIVYGSGVVELCCAAAVLCPRTRRSGAWASAALFVAVFPANVQMALDGGAPGAGFPMGSPVVAWLRLPLQVPLVLWARAVARAVV